MTTFVLLRESLPLWLMLRIARKEVGVGGVVSYSSLVTGCANPSNKFDKRSCACDLKRPGTGNV